MSAVRKGTILSLMFLYIATFPSLAAAQVALEAEGAILAGMPLRLKATVENTPGMAELWIDGQRMATVELQQGEQALELDQVRLGAGEHALELRLGNARATTSVRAIPGWLSVVPPLLAIALALIFKDVILSLFAGVFVGAWILVHWNPFTAFARTIDQFIAPALADADHAKIIIFSTLLGGMVGLITRSGGSHGIVERLRGWATSARRGQVATWLMGLFIFFDDYANTLIVGSTMRPVTDRLRISREKLAYIVDSTAAPVASVVPISTWIGFEVGLIAAAFAALDLPYDGYSMFLRSIPFRFYPILALVLGFVIAFSCRDFGPMLKAELRTSSTGKVMGDDARPLADYSASALAPGDAIPKRARNAVIPILTVIGVTIGGLWATGSPGVTREPGASLGKYVGDVFANANSYDTLLWASLAGTAVALLMALTQRLLTVREGMEAMVEGFRSMLLAMVVLILAWSIGAVTSQLHTADYVVSLTDGVVSPHWLGVLVFVIGAAISFATGTSWGTMAILMPLAIPIAHQISLTAGHAVGTGIYEITLLGVISSVLAGSVWGDHCSPISDTTILSSMASGCDHIAHVRTQLPYALGIGVLGMVVGDIPTGYGLSPWISLLTGTVVIVAGVLWFGRRSDWGGEENPAEAS
ncbi:MAG TPA: Na+/H+ antiporter NhaC family protein [Thermoanaerobaculia bacterium]|nr:Na+/H+ antiporter NhaC family protein [Thermoanaerobaculia bacterium]